MEHIESIIANLLVSLGYDLTNANFRDTPKRVAKLLREYEKPTKKEIMSFFEKKFPTRYDGMVIKLNINAKSMCPHHLKDIEYKIVIGIIYNGQALGISKFTRLAKRLARQLIIQEDLTMDIVDYLERGLKPKGVAVVVKGIHGCEKFRGIEQEVPTITTKLTGPFYQDDKCRQEFFNHINN